MIIFSFKSKADAEKVLEKAQKVERYAAELVDCLEEAHMEDEDDSYEKYNYRGGRGSGSTSMRMYRGRYGYNG